MQRFLSLAVCGMLWAPAVAQSQRAASEPAPPTAVSLAPTVDNASVALKQRSAPATAPTLRPQESQRSNMAMMVIGAAAILVGAIVDDNDASTILIIGGAGIGLIGLYRYIN